VCCIGRRGPNAACPGRGHGTMARDGPQLVDGARTVSRGRRSPRLAPVVQMSREAARVTSAAAGLAVLVIAGPILVALAKALVQLVIVAGVVVIVVRAVFFATRPW
jgi:hypothetical protein